MSNETVNTSKQPSVSEVDSSVWFAGMDEGAPSDDSNVCVVHITPEDHQRLMRADMPGVGTEEDAKFKRQVYDRIMAMKSDDPTIEVRVQVFHSANGKGERERTQ